MNKWRKIKKHVFYDMFNKSFENDTTGSDWNIGFDIPFIVSFEKALNNNFIVELAQRKEIIDKVDIFKVKIELSVEEILLKFQYYLSSSDLDEIGRILDQAGEGYVVPFIEDVELVCIQNWDEELNINVYEATESELPLIYKAFTGNDFDKFNPNHLKFLYNKRCEGFGIDFTKGGKILRFACLSFQDFFKEKYIDNKFYDSLNYDENEDLSFLLTPDIYLFFDTETTGLPKNYDAPINDSENWPRLVQLAYLLYDENENKISSGNFIIKPDNFTIPLEATEIHNITTEKANISGMDLSKVLKVFESIIQCSDYIIAHNISYDENILGAEFIRKGIKNPFSSKSKICTMKESTEYCAIPSIHGFRYPKLTELHFKLFNLGIEDSHNAEKDVEATAKCFFELKKLNKVKIAAV